MPAFLKSIISITLIVISLSTSAQRRELDNDQYFKSDFKGVVQPLPLVGNWIDDSHIIITKAGKAVVLNCKTGIERAAADVDYASNVASKINTYNKNGNIF